MVVSRSIGYVPYGAYELKANYQRNLILGDLLVLAMAAIICSLAHVLTPAEKPDGGLCDPDSVLGGRTCLSPPITIITDRRPGAAAQRLPEDEFKAGPLAPVSDDLPLEEEIMLPTQQELREIIGTEKDQMGGGGFDSVPVSPATADYFDDNKPFEHAEKDPVVVYLEQPEYPRLARLAGLTGTVIIQVVVERDGSVKEAKVLVSSQVQVLDDAALKAAYKNRFRPGIQNGRAVRCAVKYPVKFDLQ